MVAETFVFEPFKSQLERPPAVCGPDCCRISHVGPYPPSLSGYTHGRCRCCACRAENTIKRQQQRAGEGTPRRSFEDRVRQEMTRA